MSHSFGTRHALCGLPLVGCLLLAGPGLAQAPGGDPSGGAPQGASGGQGAGGGSFSSGGGGGATGGSAAPSGGGGGGGADSLFGLKQVADPKVMTLDEALAIADRQSWDLRIAKERIIQSEANVRRAWAAVLPQVSAGANYTFSYPQVEVAFGGGEQAQQQALLFDNLANITEASAVTGDERQRAEAAENAEELRRTARELRNTKSDPIVITPYHQVGGQLSVTMPIFNGRAIPLLLNAYEAVDVAELSTSQARAALMHAVARSYFAAVTAEKFVAIAEQQLANSRKHRDATRQRVELGVATPLTLQRAELDVIRAEQSVTAARNTVNVATGALGSLLGVEEQFIVSVPDPIPAVELEAGDEELVSRALGSRPDLRVQKASLSIADRNRTDAWMQFLPSVGLTASGRVNSNVSGFNSNPFTGAVVLSASIPIYDGGTRYAALKESGSKIREELLRVRQLEDRIKGQVRGNVADIGVKREGLVISERAVDLSRKTAENASNLYELGVATSLDVIDANLALFLAEIELARAQLDLEQSRLGLMYVLGEFPGPLSGDGPTPLSDDEAERARSRMDALPGHD